MTDDDSRGDHRGGGDEPPADRESPVGAPVVRGDRAVTGRRAADAVAFDPGDPESLERAAETVRSLATTDSHNDNIYVLRGAAAAAALVRGEGSYRAAAERAGDAASVPFIRKWARVHDLPEAIRRSVATGEIAPSAAKHVARVGGEDRYLLAWATIDGELTVRDVRLVASAINDGIPTADALAEVGVELGEISVRLPVNVYRELRRQAILADEDPNDVVARALDRHLGGVDG